MFALESNVPVVLIGHSLGGAICVHTASRKLIPLAGLVVIDVVEGSFSDLIELQCDYHSFRVGTALESLSSMEALVRGRPSKFSSLENAIEWSFRSGHIK